MRNSNTKQLASMGLLCAIVIVLQYLGSFIKFGPFSITLVLVPIVIGAALYGPLSGAILGFVFGLVVLLSGDAGTFLAYSPAATILVVLLKGTACGYVAGVIYKRLENKGQNLAAILASLSAPIVNTGVFLIGCNLFFIPLVQKWAGDSNVMSYMIVTMVGLNFVWEMLINAALSSTVVRLIKIAKKEGN